MRVRPAWALPALLAVAACGGAGARGAETAAAPAERGLARLLSARDIAGEPVGPAPPGAATVVVVFATWCHPCRHELRLLGALAAAEPRLRILGLNAYEEWGDRSNERRMRRFLAESAPWLEVVVRADDRMLEAFGGIPKVPTLFVYDAGGRVVREFRRTHRAPPTRRELEQAIAAALGTADR